MVTHLSVPDPSGGRAPACSLGATYKGRRKPAPTDDSSVIVHEVTCVHCLRDALTDTRNKLYAAGRKEG